ncbi:MAG: hypothetical protein ACYC6W_09300 [Nitrosotalea sp.]
MSFIQKFKHKVDSTLKTEKPKLNNDDKIDKRIAKEVTVEIEEIINNNQRFREIVEKELESLLDNLSVKELGVAKHVYLDLRSKHPELLETYKIKENKQKS